MSKVQESLQNLDDRIESTVQAIRGEREWWPCQRGCDHCCRHLAHPPKLSAAEWERIDEAISMLPVSGQAAIAQQIEALLQQIVENTLGSFIVCPYLNQQEGSCYIYDSRPIICRTYGFFVDRGHDLYCQQIETEVGQRGETAIVWGNAAVIDGEIERISGVPVAFEVHYRGQ